MVGSFPRMKEKLVLHIIKKIPVLGVTMLDKVIWLVQKKVKSVVEK